MKEGHRCAYVQRGFEVKGNSHHFTASAKNLHPAWWIELENRTKTSTHRHRYPLSGSLFVAMLWLYQMWSDRGLKYGGVGRGMCEFVMCLYWNRKDRRQGLQSGAILPHAHSETHTLTHCGEWNSSSLNSFHLKVEVSARFPGVTPRYSTLYPLQIYCLLPVCVCFVRFGSKT